MNSKRYPEEFKIEAGTQQGNRTALDECADDR